MTNDEHLDNDIILLVPFRIRIQPLIHFRCLLSTTIIIIIIIPNKMRYNTLVRHSALGTGMSKQIEMPCALNC